MTLKIERGGVHPEGFSTLKGVPKTRVEGVNRTMKMKSIRGDHLIWGYLSFVAIIFMLLTGVYFLSDRPEDVFVAEPTLETTVGEYAAFKRMEGKAKLFSGSFEETSKRLETSDE